MNPRGRLYVGSTANLRRRVLEHNASPNKDTVTAREGRPWTLLDARALPSMRMARAAEYAVQADERLKAIWLHALNERMAALMRTHARSRTRWHGPTECLRIRSSHR